MNKGNHCGPNVVEPFRQDVNRLTEFRENVAVLRRSSVASVGFEGAPEGMIVGVAPDNNHVPTKKRMVWLLVKADPTVAAGR